MSLGMNQRDVWAAPWQRGAQRPLDLPLRGGPGLGVSGGLVSVRDRAEKITRYVPDRLPVAGGDFKGCWFPTAVDSTHVNLTGGTFTCGGVAFTPSVSGIVVSSSALTYIYLRATLSAYTDDGYVTGGVATAVDIIGSTTELASAGTTGYIKLCTWQAEALVARYEYFSLKARLGNSGVGTIVFEHGMA